MVGFLLMLGSAIKNSYRRQVWGDHDFRSVAKGALNIPRLMCSRRLPNHGPSQAQ